MLATSGWVALQTIGYVINAFFFVLAEHCGVIVTDGASPGGGGYRMTGGTVVVCISMSGGEYVGI